VPVRLVEGGTVCVWRLFAHRHHPRPDRSGSGGSGNNRGDDCCRSRANSTGVARCDVDACWRGCVRHGTDDSCALQRLSTVAWWNYRM